MSTLNAYKIPLENECNHEITVSRGIVKIHNQIFKKEYSYKIYLCMKRSFDIVFSMLALIILSPLLFIVSLVIKISDRGPIFYCSNRVGENGKIFKMYKFRSMILDAEKYREDLQKYNKRDGPVFKVINDPRVTKFGKFLRKTCIDELPQLLNIIKGDMSIVGPRPPLQNEVEKYTKYQMHRLEVRPGLTCYWQIHKGTTTNFAQWVRYDIRYIKYRCFFEDIRIIFKTVMVVLKLNGDE